MERLGCQIQLERNQSLPSHTWKLGSEAAQSSCSPVVPEAVEEVSGGWRPGLEKRAQEEIGKAGEEVRQAQRTWHREGDPKRSRRQLGQEGVRAGASHTVREEKGKRERQLSQALCLLWRPRRR